MLLKFCLVYFICNEVLRFALCQQSLRLKSKTYPIILSVWIQPIIHSFNNITPKNKAKN